MAGYQKSIYQDQTTIINMISSGLPLKQILECIITSVENYCLPMNVSGSILLYNSNSAQNGDFISCSLPNDFIRGLQPSDIDPYASSCGTSVFFKQPVMFSNIAEDRLWVQYRNLANKYGYHTCLATPIISSKTKLVGTLMLYCKEIQPFDNEKLETLTLYNDLAAIAIELSRTTRNRRLAKIVCDDVKPRDVSKCKRFQQLNIAMDKCEFEIFYQPYFGLEKKKFGMEALIRWNHPHSGLLSPGAFLEVAEETGFILEMEKWVLAQSIRQVRAFQQRGMKDAALSVNISAHQFENHELPEIISGLLTTTAFNPKNLTLEVTERFLIRQENIAVIERLKNLGVRISIDDFGSSYSSLQYLKDLAIDELKIDRSFISDIHNNRNSRKIVQMIIELGHELQLNVVAEGIENEQQLQILKELKCDIVQGYYFSKPVPFTKIEQNYQALWHRERTGSAGITSHYGHN